ncbi:hypothetical protein BHM03_00020977 [Ensete ventricosum]|nr:hypothetical protein BHM03_00020977 [Ensete ventricosum]
MPTSARATELVPRRKDKQNKCNLAPGRTSGAYDTKNKSQNWRSQCRILCKVAQPVICIATSGGIILYAMGVGDHGLVSRDYGSGCKALTNLSQLELGCTYVDIFTEKQRKEHTTNSSKLNDVTDQIVMMSQFHHQRHALHDQSQDRTYCEKQFSGGSMKRFVVEAAGSGGGRSAAESGSRQPWGRGEFER